jgi:tetratricopeptide (TPR) repeat protein
VAGDFDGARQAFYQAWRILEERGTNNPAERSLLSLEAYYIKDVGEFETAEAILEEALELYKAAGDVHMQGRVLVQMEGRSSGTSCRSEESSTFARPWL